MKLKGLKKAIGDFKRFNAGGYNFWDEHWIPLYLARNDEYCEDAEE